MTLTLFDDLVGHTDGQGITWTVGDIDAANWLLRRYHYLGPISGGSLVIVGHDDGLPVAAQVWRYPTARLLPADGTWLEMSRWCLIPPAGPNAGSRCHRYSVQHLRARGARTVVSYSDPAAGHDGALYRACNWLWAPTWHRLRPPPSGGGDWNGRSPQGVKDRWVFHVTKHDPHRDEVLALPARYGQAAAEHWQRVAPAEQRRWAAASPYMRRWAA